MALNWLWSEKCGEVKYGDQSVNLYEGNAFRILFGQGACKKMPWTGEGKQ